MPTPSAVPTPVPGQPTVRLLCVEDSDADVELLGFALRRADPGRRYLITHVEDAAGFEQALSDDLDAILCDYNMPLFSPEAALRLLAARGSPVPLIVVTHSIGEEGAVKVLRQGARDYVTKDKLATLPQVIQRVMSDRRILQEDRRLKAELAAAYQHLKGLSERVVAAQERERSLMSRELHDVLGQTLTAVVIHLHAAARSEDPARSRTHSETALAMAQDAIRRVKTLSFSLRPAQLDLLGLVPAVESAVHGLADAAGLEVSISTRGEAPAAPDVRASVAVRLVQEAVTNTVRHARAARIRVRLRFLPGGRMVLLVADDGIGFDPAALIQGATGEHNLGLHGMMERAELIGGKLRFRSAPGCGVILRALL
ncbi:MAG: histidine kinase [Burkholderiaceae bacterium]|nr:histidine kinase [Burkholderiaceae bacterium]